VAAPVGHIICALALLNSGSVKVDDSHAFFAGTLFPDIRYITNIERKATHQLKESSLLFVKKADSSFELGRRLHILVDLKREEHMRKNGAYDYIKNNLYSTQMLKMVEDNILFDKLKNNFSLGKILDKIYPEERAYKISDKNIYTWHQILKSYLDTNKFKITRYYQAAQAYKRAFGLPERLFKDFLSSAKTMVSLVYAYIQIERLSRDEKLRAIVLDFYENKINELVILGK
jgi:hypothetical protein